MSKQEIIYEALQCLDDEDLLDVWETYCSAIDRTSELRRMNSLDDELDDYTRFNTFGALSSYYYVYELIQQAVGYKDFDIDDEFFVLDTEYDKLTSYGSVSDYVEEFYDDIIDYILENNDCLGDLTIESALDEIKEDEDDWEITFKTYYRN